MNDEYSEKYEYKNINIISFPFFNYYGQKQRPQHLLGLLSGIDGFNVHWINCSSNRSQESSNLSFPIGREDFAVYSGIESFVRYCSSIYKPGINILYINSVKNWIRIQNFINRSPVKIDMIWFDYIDDFPAERAAAEILARKADIITTSCIGLSESIKSVVGNSKNIPVLIENGCNFEMFNAMNYRKCNIIPHKSIVGKVKPIITFIGTLSNWIDFGLIEKISKRFTNSSIILAGKKATPAVDEIVSKCKNVNYIGEVEYSCLPSILLFSDICLIPFIKSGMTDKVLPLKMFEYAAAAKFIVSTDMPEVELKMPGVTVGDCDSFVLRIEDYIKNPFNYVDQIDNNWKVSSENDWSKSLNKVVKIINSKAIERHNVKINQIADDQKLDDDEKSSVKDLIMEVSQKFISEIRKSNRALPQSHNRPVKRHDSHQDIVDEFSWVPKKDFGSSVHHVTDIKNSKTQLTRIRDEANADIVITTFNRLSNLKRCLKSVFTNTEASYQLIIIDAGSTDGTREWLHSNIVIPNRGTVIYEQRRFSYAQSCNNGMRYGRAKYVAMVNDDCEVHTGWLKACIDALDNDDKIGHAAHVVLYKSGKIMSAGANLLSDGTTDLPNAKEDWNDPQIREMMMNLPNKNFAYAGFGVYRRDLLERLGYLIELPVVIYRDDVDWGLKVNAAGYDVRLIPESVITHFMQHTNREFHKASYTIGKKGFDQRWGKFLEENGGYAPGMNDKIRPKLTGHKGKYNGEPYKPLGFAVDGFPREIEEVEQTWK